LAKDLKETVFGKKIRKYGQSPGIFLIPGSLSVLLLEIGNMILPISFRGN
jgi:hypothetical protein